MAGARRDELERRTRHQPEAVEARLFERWERECGFSGDPESDAETYVIALPPPNVTGELHMGHALNGSIQDTLMRLHRMRGRNTLWICGTDHASIAVHAVIEKQLRAEGTTRIDVGREAFVERVWEWRRETGATIIQQLKRLGCTLDYDHERFTMDEGYVRAVMEMFVRLYDKGLIYRDNRIVNWCPGCGSTVSDLEVRHERAADALYEVRYPITGSDQFLTVATVRPETILADTAVAVHPDDDRYRHLVGKTAIVPIVGREVPIIADDYVKMDFGTGALKVTPGHDPNDFEIGRRHGLPEISVIGFDGRMSAEAGEFAGLAVGEARQKVIDRLFSEQLLHGERPYEHEVGHCDRTGDRIEPLISLQWFMQMDSLAAAANAEVRSGSVRFVPKNQEAIYFHWMDNIRPWCISRQLWWGHQIPVWYCPDGHRTVSVEPPAACGECGSAELERDPDVLDTWFSSALWPFATLGWPEPNERLATFYPGNVLVTARDIINLWVARMLMMGIEFMGEKPFSDVYITSIIQAADGRRMSKSLGTGINPLDLIEQFGADGTRYGLLKMSSTQDVRFSEGMLDEGAKLANKLWNAARFVLLQTDPEAEPAPLATTAEDRWILSRLAGTIDEVRGAAGRLRLRRGREGAVRVHLERLLRLVRGGRQGAAVRRGRDGAAPGVGDAAVGARADGGAGPPGDAVRDRGDLGLPAGRARDAAGVADARAAARAPRPGARGVGPQRHGGGVGGAAPGRRGRAAAGDGGAGVAVHGAAGAREGRGRRARRRLPRQRSVVARGDRESLEAKLKAAVAEHERARSKLANEGFLARAPAQLVDAEREKAERFAGEVSDIQRRLEAL